MTDNNAKINPLQMCTHSGTLKVMENTNPRQFRSELKTYLDKANEKPIRIQRRDGDSFVLMNEARYEELVEEISSLQRRLLASSDILEGKAKDFEVSKEKRLGRFKK